MKVGKKRPETEALPTSHLRTPDQPLRGLDVIVCLFLESHKLQDAAALISASEEGSQKLFTANWRLRRVPLCCHRGAPQSSVLSVPLDCGPHSHMSTIRLPAPTWICHQIPGSSRPSDGDPFVLIWEQGKTGFSQEALFEFYSQSSTSSSVLLMMNRVLVFLRLCL